MIRRTLPMALAAVLAVGLMPALAIADDVAPAPDSRVVVAPIDSGINPYHEQFQVEQPNVTQDVLEEFGITEDRILRISDNYDADVAAGVYDGVQTGVDYWFEGTNIIVRSSNFGSRPFLPNSESDTHGTGVSGSVAIANPEAIIYFHEGISDANETHAFTHRAVDMVTTSYGAPTAVPLGNIAGSFEGVVENGKFHFGANPNDPSLGPLDSTGGPWWALSISGYQEEGSGGKQILSGSAPDFVANFTQRLPYCATCNEGTRSVSGTSFATPTSAGLMSRAVLQLRRDAGHVGGIQTIDGTAYMVAGEDLRLTNWDLRRALEEAAAVPTVGEFSPGGGLFDLTAYPNPPVAGYTLYGWGLLTDDPMRDTVQAVIDFVETGQTTKDADTCTFMTAHFEARVLAWQANVTADGFGASADGHIPC
ncbi:hypothetical protein BH23ACT9_BH23ACT9_03810 [soil metagenome]